MGAGGDFDAFYAAEYARLVGELFAMTGSMPEAEDVVQEAFARAYGRWPRVAHLDAPAAWVRRVAMNLATSRWRRLVTHRAFVRDHRPAGGRPDEDAGVDLAVALAALPPARRRELVLHHVAGLSVAEIAAGLGVPEGTVKARLSRARAALRGRLEVREDA